ncbi:MAG: hypothetical protein KAF91_01005 [Nostoc sp. TH1S01]|nr:hypothetical protein [Nostoc sp. TH1S01]
MSLFLLIKSRFVQLPLTFFSFPDQQRRRLGKIFVRGCLRQKGAFFLLTLAVAATRFTSAIHA